MIGFLLFDISFYYLQIVGYDRVHVELINDNWNRDMVMYVPNNEEWPELQGEYVTFSLHAFTEVPLDVSYYELLSFRIIKDL